VRVRVVALHQPAGLQVPHPHGLIIAHRNNKLARGVEHKPANPVVMPGLPGEKGVNIKKTNSGKRENGGKGTHKSENALAGDGVPKFNGPVSRAREEVALVRILRDHNTRGFGVSRGGQQFLNCLNGRGRCKGEALHHVLVTPEFHLALASPEVPEPQRLVV